KEGVRAGGGGEAVGDVGGRDAPGLRRSMAAAARPAVGAQLGEERIRLVEGTARRQRPERAGGVAERQRRRQSVAAGGAACRDHRSGERQRRDDKRPGGADRGSQRQVCCPENAFQVTIWLALTQ